jgi:hypothetical protein
MSLSLICFYFLKGMDVLTLYFSTKKKRSKQHVICLYRIQQLEVVGKTGLWFVYLKTHFDFKYLDKPINGLKKQLKKPKSTQPKNFLAARSASSGKKKENNT